MWFWQVSLTPWVLTATFQEESSPRGLPAEGTPRWTRVRCTAAEGPLPCGPVALPSSVRLSKCWLKDSPRIVEQSDAVTCMGAAGWDQVAHRFQNCPTCWGHPSPWTQVFAWSRVRGHLAAVTAPGSSPLLPAPALTHPSDRKRPLLFPTRLVPGRGVGDSSREWLSRSRLHLRMSFEKLGLQKFPDYPDRTPWTAPLPMDNGSRSPFPACPILPAGQRGVCRCPLPAEPSVQCRLEEAVPTPSQELE